MATFTFTVELDSNAWAAMGDYAQGQWIAKVQDSIDNFAHVTRVEKLTE